MHGPIWPVTIPPPPPEQPPGLVQPFGSGGGELFEAVLSRGQGGRANLKYLLLDFAKYPSVCVISRAVFTMAVDLKTTYF